MNSFLSLVSKIDPNIFTKKEKLIIEFIKLNMKKVVNMKIEELAQSVEVGYSAIYGILRKMKLPGYRNFILSISTDIEIEQLNSSYTSSITKKAYFDFVNQNHLIHEYNALSETVHDIMNADRIIVYGNSLASTIAKYLADELYTLGYSSKGLQYIGGYRNMNPTFLKEGDLLIIYNFYSIDFFPEEFFKSALENNVKIITVCNKDYDYKKYNVIRNHVVYDYVHEELRAFRYVNPMLSWMFFTDKILNRLWSHLEDDRKQDIFNKFKTLT